MRIGGGIITTNSLWTNLPRMEMADLPEKWGEYTQISAEIALEVRTRLRLESYVAGSIAPALKGETPGEVEGQVMALAEFGVDIILLEYFSRLDPCVNDIKESFECGRPVFLGTNHIRTDGKLYTEESAETLALSLEDLKVDAILAMCSKPKGISAFLPNLRQDFTVQLVPMRISATVGMVISQTTQTGNGMSLRTNNTLPTATLNLQNNGWRWVPRLLADVVPPLLSTSKRCNLSFKPGLNLARCRIPAGTTVNIETIAPNGTYKHPH